MEPQTVINALFALTGALGGWILSSLSRSIRDLREDHKAHVHQLQGVQLVVAGDYVKKTELTELSAAIIHKIDQSDSAHTARLERIEGKLDKKADK
jgi:hypothetical protein